jgi:hypothetical protein
MPRIDDEIWRPSGLLAGGPTGWQAAMEKADGRMLYLPLEDYHNSPPVQTSAIQLIVVSGRGPVSALSPLVSKFPLLSSLPNTSHDRRWTAVIGKDPSTGSALEIQAAIPWYSDSRLLNLFLVKVATAGWTMLARQAIACRLLHEAALAGALGLVGDVSDDANAAPLLLSELRSLGFTTFRAQLKHHGIIA